MPFAKNCGHCAKDVGSGVSSAALSNCGDRAQERVGRATLERDRASTAARRTRPGQENKRFTEETGKWNKKVLDWSTVHPSSLFQPESAFFAPDFKSIADKVISGNAWLRSKHERRETTLDTSPCMSTTVELVECLLACVQSPTKERDSNDPCHCAFVSARHQEYPKDCLIYSFGNASL